MEEAKKIKKEALLIRLGINSLLHAENKIGAEKLSLINRFVSQKVLAVTEGRIQTASKLIKDLQKDAILVLTLVEKKKELDQGGVDFMTRISRALDMKIEEEISQMIDALKTALFAKDPTDTGPHSKRVSEDGFIDTMNFTEEMIQEIRERYDMDADKFRQWFRIGAMVHDVGKIGIRDAVLSKPARLDKEEFAVMKFHTSIGHGMIQDITKEKENGFTQMLFDMTLYHHERYDGKGYPNGLKGKDIPISARIMAIIDSWDAATNHRVYKGGGKQQANNKTPEDMIKEFEEDIKKAEKGESKYDPELLRLFVGHKKKELKET